MTFTPLVHALLEALNGFAPIAASLGFAGQRTIGAERQEDGTFTLQLNYQDFPAGITSPRFQPTAHQRLALTQASSRLAQAFGALETATTALKGYPHGDYLGVLFQPWMTTAGAKLGVLVIEGAALCASRTPKDNGPDLRDQANALAAQLGAAQQMITNWGNTPLEPWFIVDMPDQRGRGGRIREVLAHSPSSALDADICWHWQRPPAPETTIRRLAVPTLEEARQAARLT